MKVAVSYTGVIVAIVLLACPILAQQQQSQERKPVPSYSNDDLLPGPRSVAVESSSEPVNDTWSKSASAWPLLKSVRARMTLDSPNGPVSVLVEAAQPDRFHMSTSGFEIITIGADTYMKTPAAGWAKQQANTPQAFSVKGFMGDEFLKGGNPKLVGSEKIGGVNTDVYDVTAALGTAGTARVWIGKSDGLPRKLTGNVGGMNVNVTFYDFNKNDISIKAPM
jgi:hypothetical protein